MHRVCRFRLADCTADRDFHPALKTSHSVVPIPIIHTKWKNASPNLKNKCSINIDLPFWIYYNGNNIQRTEGRNEPRDNLLLYRPQAGEAALAGGRGDPRCLELKARLAGAVEAAYEKGMRHFLCGMARGADFYCCEAALALRERRPGVTVEAVIPCEEQAARWRERDRERWFSLVERCDNETMLQHHYDRGACSGGIATWWTTRPC